METSLIAVLFLLMNAVQYSSCERFNIVPTPDSSCPGEFTGEPCLTLEQYVANPSLSSNITFELHPGNHSLNSQLSVSNINSFTMRANTSATVICNQQLDTTFYFNRLQQIHVSGITFVGCRMYLRYITNATFERSLFVNRSRCCRSGVALNVQYSSVLLRLCTISNNRVDNGAIYGYRSTFMIEQTVFKNNYYPYTCCSNRYGGAIYLSGGSMDILNSNFSSNLVTYGGHGGAIYTVTAQVTIIGSYFNDNRAGSNGGYGGAIYMGYSAVVTIIRSYFSDNTAGSHGGAVYYDGGNITVANNTFINNTASGGGGGAIYSARRYTNISVVNNIFSHNTAAYCGVMDVAEFYHYHVNITGNTFVHNRAIQRISGNNGGDVICVRNASILLLDNNFSHNSAAGDAGVIQVDESDIIIERSIFSNNTAGGNGGVLHTYFYPTRYTIIDSSFTNNQAGGDGGVMYVGRAGSHVTVSQGTFGFNNATNRGGVIAIIGSTLEVNRASIFENTAELGEVVSACNSNVTITNPQLLASQDPIYSFCSLYDSSNTTISRTTEQITPTTGTTTNPVTGASTATESDALTTTIFTPPDDITSTEIAATTTEGMATSTPPTEEETTPTEDDSITTTVSTTENIDIATTTIPVQGTTTTASATEQTTTVAATEEVTTTTPTSQEITTTDDIIITPTDMETSTTEESISTTTPPLVTLPDASTKPDTTTDLSTTEDSVITSTNELPKELPTTQSTISTTTLHPLPKESTTAGNSITSDPTMTDSSTTVPITESSESTNAVPTATRPDVSPVGDDEQDTAEYNLHTIVPGYVAIGASAVLLVFIAFIGLLVIVVIAKVFRAKSKPQKVNLSSPTIKNEYTLPDVHIVST